MVQWNVRALPLRAGVVDCVVTDLPFGMKCKSKARCEGVYDWVAREVREDPYCIRVVSLHFRAYVGIVACWRWWTCLPMSVIVLDYPTVHGMWCWACRQAARTLRPSTGRTILLGSGNNMTEMLVAAGQGYLTVDEQLAVNMEGLALVVVVLQRTPDKWQAMP